MSKPVNWNNARHDGGDPAAGDKRYAAAANARRRPISTMSREEEEAAIEKHIRERGINSKGA